MNTMTNNQTKLSLKTVLSIRSLTVMAMLSALAAILMLFEVPLWFAPSFYKLDFSEVPVLIGAFTLGPIAGIIIELIKILLNFVLNGTMTGGIGELANFLIGSALVVPAAIIYQKKKSRKNATIGLVIGTIFMTVIGGLLNVYLLLPFYAKNFMPMEVIIEAGTKVNASITSLSTFILYAVTPFNLLKGVVVSLITILLYKRLSILIKTITK